MTTRMEAQWCPCCFNKLNANSQVVDKGDRRTESAPEPGDLTVCIDCGSILSFDDAMKLYEVKDIEEIELTVRARLFAVQREIKTLGPKPTANFWRM